MKLLALIATLLLANPGFADTKIGWLDLQRTLNETNVGKKARAKLEAEKTSKQKEVDAKKTAFQKKVEDLEKQKSVLKPEALDAKRAELEKEYLKMQEQFAGLQQSLAKMEATLTRQIMLDAAGIIESIAKRDGYAFILEKTESALIYAAPAGDITAEVNQRLDKGETAKPAAKPAKK